MNKLTLNLGILALGLIASLAAVETGFRLVHASAHRRPPSDRPHYYYMPLPSDGARDSIHVKDKAQDTFRIAIIGDSFTFGPDVQFDDTYPKRLERMFNLNQGNRKVETLNFGTPGASTVQEIPLFHQALSYHPDAILLQITLNDAQLRHLDEEPEDVRSEFKSLRDSNLLPSWLYHWQSLTYVLERIHSQHSIQAYINYHQNLYRNPLSWEPFQNALALISERARAEHVPLAAVIFPLFDFKIDSSYPFKDIHAKIGAALEALGVPHLDLQDAFRGLTPERLQTRPGQDSHPNEIAHRIAADALAKWLTKSQIIPEEFFPRHVFRERDNLKEKSVPSGSHFRM